MITDGLELQHSYMEFLGAYVDEIRGDDLDDMSEFAIHVVYREDPTWSLWAPIPRTLVSKGVYGTSGWWLGIDEDNQLNLRVFLGTTIVNAVSATAPGSPAGWRFASAHYKDSTKTGTVGVNGVWAASSIGEGTYQSDSGLDLTIGRQGENPAYWFYGDIQFVSLWDTAVGGVALPFTVDWLPPLPTEAHLVECWPFSRRTYSLVPSVSESHRGIVHAGGAHGWAHGDWRTEWSEVVGLPESTISDLRDATGDLVVKVAAEQYLPNFAVRETFDVADKKNFDAIVDSGTIIYVRAAGGDLHHRTLPTEDVLNREWSLEASLSPAPEVDQDVMISLATDGAGDTRLFYYDGTSIRYYGTALGVGLWDAAPTTVANIANVHFLAAPRLDRVHCLVATGSNNFRFYTYNYSGGAWNSISSGIYWQTTPETFRAVACPDVDVGTTADADITVMATDIPFVFGRKLQGLELAYTLRQVKGLVLNRWQNGRWSEAWALDWTDEPLHVRARARSRLSVSGDWLFLTYQRTLGSENYQTNVVAISRSKDGIHWECPYMMEAPDDADAIVLVRGDHVYLLASTYCYRSPLCNFFGDVAEDMELTPYVMQLAETLVDSNSLQLTLANPNIPDVSGHPYPYRGELEYEDPRHPSSEASLLMKEVALQIRLHLGYKVGRELLAVQTGLFDVDYLSRSRDATSYIQVGGRGIVSRLETVLPDHTNEWENQTIGADDFSTPDSTDYSGLRRCAIMKGSFDTPNGQYYLRNIYELGESVVFSTFLSAAWHGSISTGIYCADATGAWAGLVFHAYDSDNLMFYAYDGDSDTLQVKERRNGVDSTLHTSGVMGWNKETWYWIRMRFAFGYAYPLYSTDGITWTSLIAGTLVVELPGMSAAWSWDEGWLRLNANWANWVAGGIPFMGGRVGLIGNGYDVGVTETRWKDVVVSNFDPPLSLEDSFRTLGAFAGVHDFDFESKIDEQFADLDDWTTDAEATWNVAGGDLEATGGGAAGTFYQARYTEEITPTFVAHFDLISGIGGFIFHGKQDANDCLVVWWNTTNCGLQYINNARGGTQLLTLPYGVSAVSGAGSSMIGHFMVRVGWQSDTLDDQKRWLLVSMFVDGVEYFSHAVDYSDYDWAGDSVGFAVWVNNTMQVDNLYLQDLHHEVQYLSVDPGESLGEGLRRAIGSTKLRMSELPDGTLQVRKGMDNAEDWEVPHARVDSFEERLDRIKVLSHVRVFGATRIVNVLDLDSCASFGHRFRHVDDPNLESEAEVHDEGNRQLATAEEEQHTARLAFQLQPLIQVWDRISYNDVDWRVLGVRHQVASSGKDIRLQTQLDLREYISYP